MRDIELIVLDFIVGTPVFAFSKFVVAPSIFVAVPEDGAGYARGVAESIVIVAKGRVGCIWVFFLFKLLVC